MQTLREGSRGEDVTALQQKLQDRGFPPGRIDGNFGLGTEAAVLAFQQSEGLFADGIVGPGTAVALGFLEKEPEIPEITLEIVSRMVPSRLLKKSFRGWR